MGKLNGKVTLITGASRGLGRVMAHEFAREGARVVCAARTLEEGGHPLEGSLQTTVEEILDAGGEATPIAANVSSFEECQSLVQSAREAYGPIDVLVNNAALTYFFPIAEFPVAKWLRSVAVNFHAPFFLSKLVLEDMIPRRSGAIVNISSGAAVGPGRGPYRDVPLSGGTLYGAEKAALERFTQGLAAEVYPHRISVTCVSPSKIVPTPGAMFHRLLQREDDPNAESPQMMARAVVLLATEPLDRVTGRVTYSQQILQEFGWIERGRGFGVDTPGSGYAQL